MKYHSVILEEISQKSSFMDNVSARFNSINKDNKKIFGAGIGSGLVTFLGLKTIFSNISKDIEGGFDGIRKLESASLDANSRKFETVVKNMTDQLKENTKKVNELIKTETAKIAEANKQGAGIGNLTNTIDTLTPQSMINSPATRSDLVIQNTNANNTELSGFVITQIEAIQKRTEDLAQRIAMYSNKVREDNNYVNKDIEGGIKGLNKITGDYLSSVNTLSLVLGGMVGVFVGSKVKKRLSDKKS